MADAQSVATLIDSTTSKIQRLQQAFSELENHSAISLNLKWKELEEHFHGLEKSLKRRFNELEDQEKDYVNKVSETQDVLEKHESMVIEKEQASLDRLQEKRDAALSSIFDTSKNYPLDLINNATSDRLQATREENLDCLSAKIDKEDLTLVENDRKCSMPYSQLMKLCEEMDAKGLLKFISDNRKNLSSIRQEIPNALRIAIDPFHLVFDSLMDFYPRERLELDGKKDSDLLGMRRTGLMLLECLGHLLEDVSSSVSDNLKLTASIKEQAMAIASKWKPKLDDLDIDAICGNSLEVHAYLQLLATFNIASEFDQDALCKLIPTVSRRRQTVDLCRSLGLSKKLPGVVDMLVNSGRQIEAVNLAYAFELTEQFSPVPLLKAYLKEAREVSHEKAGNMSPGVQNEVNDRELSALKAVIKCIEDHKLETGYPLDPLKKRIEQLEKTKADVRIASEAAAKPQPKRPRANGVAYRAPERYPYSYDRQYLYPYSYESRSLPPLLSPYTASPTHTTYYGSAYQVQYAVPYLYANKQGIQN